MIGFLLLDKWINILIITNDIIQTKVSPKNPIVSSSCEKPEFIKNITNVGIHANKNITIA